MATENTPATVLQAWQSTLDCLKRDGTFEKIYRRYLPDADLGDLLKADKPSASCH